MAGIRVKLLGSGTYWGGFCARAGASVTWARLCANASGLNVLRHDHGVAGGTLGAARLAQMAVTGLSPAQVCTRPPVQETIAPQACAMLDERLARYRRLYPLLREEFAGAAAAAR